MSGDRLRNPPANAGSKTKPKNEFAAKDLLDRLPVGLSKKQRDAEIRRRYANGHVAQALAQHYGLSRGTIYHICKGVQHKHRPEEERDAEIRERWLAGERQEALAMEYLLSRCQIMRICKGAKIPREQRNAEIRERYAKGESARKIAADYGIERRTVQRLCKGMKHQ